MFVSDGSAVSGFFPGFSISQSFKHLLLQNFLERDMLIFLSRPHSTHLIRSSGPPAPPPVDNACFVGRIKLSQQMRNRSYNY